MHSQKKLITDWRFKACEELEWMPATVPGTVHTDLLRNGQIEEPFEGLHEHTLQWIDKKDWEYEAKFDVEEAMLAMPNLELVFEGLDTYTDISINGQHVCSTDNMFLRWTVDVKPYLQAANNVIHIRFRSPIQEDLPKVKERGYNLPAANDQSELGGLGEDRVSVYARKAPYHYGWDWGPRFVTSGIWRDVYIQGWANSRIHDLFIEQVEVSQDQAKLVAHVEIECEQASEGTIRISNGEEEWLAQASLLPGVNARSQELVIHHPKLWWSRGLGEAHQYTFTAEWLSNETLQAEKRVKVGLRRIRLVREADDKGKSFYFELNGVPVFAKGANHIPNDSFLPEITDERYTYEIQTAVDSNMNMLRVWGGGIYEPDIFYDLCDQQGILVWQDFLFACSMYPGDEAFLHNVKKEAEYNVKRLRNHACIALWCGNNEIDVAWANYDEKLGWGGWKQEYTLEQRKELWQAYEELFHRILPEAVAAYAPGIDYWASSPMEELTGDATQHAQYSSTRGDMHYWGVWHALEPIENYNVTIGRFMSEYGFQSFPELKTVQAYAQESDMDLMSEVMKAHQKTGSGNDKMRAYMEKYLRLPNDFYGFIYMSQIMQAEAMKSAIEAHRRSRPYCMGTLYWQLNDCWPVASWSGVDYYGRWKAMQFFAKKGFKDVMLSIDGTSGARADFYIVSDLLEPFEGELEWNLFDFNGNRLKHESIPINQAANTSTKVYSIDYEQMEDVDPTRVVFVAKLLAGGSVIDCKEHYMLPATKLKLAPPSITIREVEGSNGIEFELTTNVLAKYVWLEHETEGYMSDNYFDLIPGIPYRVTFTPRDREASQPLKLEQVKVHVMTDYCSFD
ncbi:beta-mannosidase [Paenibacillus sp. 1001270B_150601_E10]|uniref:beta-mannosidase n=1 Tax=Paenibacillus sp. 1001270B_150601_E10 TaxID=2787079 RepID=UPI00189DA18F|nr:glycoside hydrolase family 2 protein [Paenibacillus sp. 1001270B_150601_E10]